MLKLQFADGTEYPVLETTAVYPSGSSAVRSRMEVHMAADAMPLEAFAALLSDAAKTQTLHLVKTAEAAADETAGAGDGADSEAAETAAVVFDMVYTGYTLPARVGKERAEAADPATGAVLRTQRLAATLEQPTFIEQQLAKLGLEVN